MVVHIMHIRKVYSKTVKYCLYLNWLIFSNYNLCSILYKVFYPAHLLKFGLPMKPEDDTWKPMWTLRTIDYGMTTTFSYLLPDYPQQNVYQWCVFQDYGASLTTMKSRYSETRILSTKCSKFISSANYNQILFVRGFYALTAS